MCKLTRGTNEVSAPSGAPHTGTNLVVGTQLACLHVHFWEPVLNSSA